MSQKTKSSIGQILQAKREARQLDLIEVSQALRIREDHLEAIETNQFDRLPGSAYVVGFVKTYAQFLELDADDIIALYKQQTDIGQKTKLDFPEIDETREVPSMAMAFGLLAIVLVVFIFLGFLNTAENVSLEKGTLVSPQTSKPQIEPITGETVEGRPNIPAQTATQNDATVSQSQDLDAQISVTELPDISQPNFDGSDFDESGFDALPEPLAGPMPVVSIRARAPTFLRIVNAQGRILFSSIIIAGEEFIFPDEENFRLSTQNAGELEYYIDGELAGMLGARGQAFSDRLINLPRVLERFE
ncbi:MAG: helix-turn-helix domain-containing protein [Parvibaculales bacterium]